MMTTGHYFIKDKNHFARDDSVYNMLYSSAVLPS